MLCCLLPAGPWHGPLRPGLRCQLMMRRQPAARWPHPGVSARAAQVAQRTARGGRRPNATRAPPPPPPHPQRVSVRLLLPSRPAPPRRHRLAAQPSRLLPAAPHSGLVHLNRLPVARGGVGGACGRAGVAVQLLAPLAGARWITSCRRVHSVEPRQPQRSAAAAQSLIKAGRSGLGLVLCAQPNPAVRPGANALMTAAPSVLLLLPSPLPPPLPLPAAD